MIRQAAALVNQAQRPVVYAGNGVLSSPLGPKLLAQLSELGDIPVTTTLLGLGAFDETNERSLHMLGMHGSAYANLAMQSADVIIALGARFDDREGGGTRMGRGRGFPSPSHPLRRLPPFKVAGEPSISKFSPRTSRRRRRPCHPRRDGDPMRGREKKGGTRGEWCARRTMRREGGSTCIIRRPPCTYVAAIQVVSFRNTEHDVSKREGVREGEALRRREEGSANEAESKHEWKKRALHHTCRA
ncbi:DHS-like NAD/FAD-binding domain-containing protein [Schizophyllum commune]